MDGIIKHLDSLPFNEKPELADDVQTKSLEQLLAMLEDEARSAEALEIRVAVHPTCLSKRLVQTQFNPRKWW